MQQRTISIDKRTRLENWNLQGQAGSSQHYTCDHMICISSSPRGYEETRYALKRVTVV
jgi:hypothetical protein